MKVRLVIEGNVQGAGYRAMVKNVARRLRIKGLGRNLDDGTVEVFCECDENVLERFIKIIDRKGDPEQPFSLNVEKINIYNEGNVNCVGLPKEFGLFETDYRMEIDPVHKDSLERSEIGILILSSMHHDLKEGQDDLKEGQDKMLKEQSAMHQDIKEGQDSMLKEQSAMHGDIKDLRDITRDSFTELKNTYGVFHKTMGSMQEELISTRKELSKLVDYIGVLVKEHIQKTEK